MWHHRGTACWTPLVALVAVSAGGAQLTLPEYAVAQTFTLRHRDIGKQRTLVLSIDSRLSESVREELWGHGQWNFVFSPDSSLYREFSNQAPLKANLSIRDSAGRVVAQRRLETPLAKLEPVGLAAGPDQLFLLSQDYSTGEGSYNGPTTSVLSVSYAAFEEVTALNMETHREEPIRLVRSLKSDWRMSRAGGEPEILSVSCHPAQDGKFVVDYTRYQLEEKRWLGHKRQAAGFWESDDPFPDQSAFH